MKGIMYRAVEADIGKIASIIFTKSQSQHLPCLQFALEEKELGHVTPLSLTFVPQKQIVSMCYYFVL